MAKTKGKTLKKILPATNVADALICDSVPSTLINLTRIAKKKKPEPKQSTKEAKRYKPGEIQFLKTASWNCLANQPPKMFATNKIVLDKIPLKNVQNDATVSNRKGDELDQILLDINGALNANQSTVNIPATDLMAILSNLSLPINGPPISSMPVTSSTTATYTDQILKANLGTVNPCPLLLAQTGGHGNIVDWVNTDLPTSRSASSTVTSNAVSSSSVGLLNLKAQEEPSIFSRFETNYVPSSSADPIATVSAASLDNFNSNANSTMAVNYLTTSPAQLTLLPLPERRVSIASIVPTHNSNNPNQQQVQGFSPCGCACMNCGSKNVWKEPTPPLSYPAFTPSFPPSFPGALPPLQTLPQQQMPMISPIYYGNNTANFFPNNDPLTAYIPTFSYGNGNPQLVYENTEINPQLMSSNTTVTPSVSPAAYAPPHSSQPRRGDYPCNGRSARWILPQPPTFNN